MWFTVGVLILVRHGRTALNADGPAAGPARRAARRRRAGAGEGGRRPTSAPVDELISSPLRAGHGRRPSASAQPYVVDERWIELAYGEYEGTAYTDVPSEAWDHWKTNVSCAPEGGESLTALDERVRGACLELTERATDRDVAVVTHVSPIKAAVAWALGSGIEISWRSHLSHASVCRIDFSGGDPVLYSFNEVAK